MNNKPNISGITRYWKPGEDDRILIMQESEVSRGTVDRVLNAFQRVIFSRPQTKIVGFGKFSWKRWHNRIPTGEFVETWRLAFKPSKNTKGLYDGNR